MKYKAGVILYANFTVNADSKDDAHDKVINSELEWYVNSHPEWDTNNKIRIDPIKSHVLRINKIKEDA